jgi:hypothetical protein
MGIWGIIFKNSELEDLNFGFDIGEYFFLENRELDCICF